MTEEPWQRNHRIHLERLAWLRAQVDEDERAARWVLGDYAQHEETWDVPSTGVVQVGDDLIPTGDGPLAQFIAGHDPGRELAEVAFKRRILDAADVALYGHGDPIPRDSEGRELSHPIARLWLLHLLNEMSELYLAAGRPGYRKEWLPMTLKDNLGPETRRLLGGERS